MKNNMSSLYVGLTIILSIILFSTGINADASLNIMTTNNREIYLGYASIWGNGTSNVLEASAENNLIIKTESASEVVDFYIEYNMNCEGLTDEGIITLTLTLDGKNISANFTQTPTIKSGTIFLNNIEIKRGDSLGFRIDVLYANLIPLYYNDTTALGAAVVSKNPILYSFFQRDFSYLFNLFQQILN